MLICAAAVVVLAAGCGGEDESSSEAWASDFCSAAADWRSSLEEMYRPILVAGDTTQGQMRATTSIGLSFFIDDIGGRRYVGHTGTQNGFKTYLTVCPATHTASILAFNTDTGSVDAESRIAAKVIALHEAASNIP